MSLAVGFIPIAGPLLSCVIDGTFVDMWDAIKSGNWAMLGMCALAFAPGIGSVGKFAKLGVKSAEKVGFKSGEKTFARIMGKNEYKNVLETGRIQSKSGRTFFTDASHMSTNSRINANKYSLPEEKKFFVEFRIKNDVKVGGPRIVEPKYGGTGGGVEYWVEEGSFIDADIVSHGGFP